MHVTRAARAMGLAPALPVRPARRDVRCDGPGSNHPRHGHMRPAKRVVPGGHGHAAHRRSFERFFERSFGRFDRFDKPLAFPEGRESLLNEYGALASSVRSVLRSPELRPDEALRHVRDARAFFDVRDGFFRILIVTPNFWAEAWVHGPRTRRAALHTAELDRAIVVEYDTAAATTRVIKNEGWPDDMTDFVYE